MHNRYLTYGLLNNTLKHVDEVENGIKCNCICSYCKESLIARNRGQIKMHHFAHSSGSDCEKAYETALHLLAKEIIKERKTILLPECFPSINYFAECGFKQPQRVINFSEVELEKFIHQKEIIIKPDAIGVDNDFELYVEFAVTHFIDYEKYQKIKNLNKNCVEIDISGIELNKEKLIEAIEKLGFYTKWIYNSEIEEEYSSFLEEHNTNMLIMIDQAFKGSNIFKLPEYYHTITQSNINATEIEEFSFNKNMMYGGYLNDLKNSRDAFDSTELDKARGELLNKLGARGNKYNTVEIDEARKLFLNKFDEGKNSIGTIEPDEVKRQLLIETDNENKHDTIEFDMVYSESDLEFSFYTKNVDFKEFKPNYALVKNNKTLFCQVDYLDRRISSQLRDVYQQKIEVPLILIRLTKFKYNTLELFTIFHESTDSFFWISNPKAEAEISRRKKERENEIIKIKKEREEKIIIRKKLEDEEERRVEAKYDNDIQEFSKNPKYQLLKIKFFGGAVKYCPKPKNEILEEFKNSRFYSHPILKRIIDGEIWNGIKYGDYDRGHIFLNKEKIFIYKEHRLPSGELINTDQKSCNLFYAGVMNIKQALESSRSNCEKCNHFIKLLSGGYETTVVCSFK